MNQNDNDPFKDIIELFERFEEAVDQILRAGRVTQSARQAADTINWLRAQPPKRLFMLAALGMATIGALVAYSSKKPPPNLSSIPHKRLPKRPGRRSRPRDRKKKHLTPRS